LYEQLLAAGSTNVNTYNSLGITLHYLGRSTEALRVLNEGVALDPSYPRIWLTLGFVNSQLGNTGQARSALSKAAQLGAGSDIGQSATKMLNALGPE
jgi:Flp pilus assembly protein TadD